MTPRREPCPIPGCFEAKAHGHLMCRTHWREVAPTLRGAVNKTWKAVRGLQGGRSSDEAFDSYLKAVVAWRAAAQAAIDFICTKEGIHAAAAR